MNWLAALIGWRSVSTTGVWDYQQNKITGRRRAVRVNASGHQPQDHIWLAGLSDQPPGHWPALKQQVRDRIIRRARGEVV
jgi:hypothetical protein